ncbi:MAG: hypothetical protein R3C11_17085 [Planctomycetaceae bacterium]
MLEKLATGKWQSTLPMIAEKLQWQSSINTAQLGMETGESEADLESALAMLGARGLAGFDVTTGKYFHRVLPFDIERVEKLQPRLKSARELVDKVTILREENGEVDCQVPGGDYEHYVRLRPTGDKCTCPLVQSLSGRTRRLQTHPGCPHSYRWRKITNRPEIEAEEEA